MAPSADGGEASFDKEQFVNAQAEDYWNLRELFQNGEIDIDELDDKLAAQPGSIKPWIRGNGSRSNRRKTCASGEGRHLIELTPLRRHSLVVVLQRRSMWGVTPAKASPET